jgi:UDP-N-acetylmuramyl pentapeptide phosphotransferase/UDP-N-acetylglucosamine-1-phosphate transferase
MFVLLPAFVVSALVGLFVVRLTDTRFSFAGDNDFSSPQKFHALPVPRVGGVAIMFGVCAAVALLQWRDEELGRFAALLLLCSLPAFLAGLVEDLTKRVSPRRRLALTALAALLAGLLLDARIVHTELPFLDPIVVFPAGALAFTVFVVAGVANSINIIDGFNGLASMCAVLILLAIAYVAYCVGDRTISTLALVGVGGVLGFFVWNYPRGLMFLGDGGAYFLGFFTAELAILLLNRNPQVSPMFPLTACIYPVFETLFSIYRRSLIKRVPAGAPDGIHLHSLVYRRLTRGAATEDCAKARTRRNSMTAPYLWLLCLCPLIPAVIWWRSTPILEAVIVGFAVLYSALYWRIVRFRAPRWLVFRR